MQLIFVYNADTGLLNLAKDALHKWFRPQTYPCSLCALTYGNFAEKRSWRQFWQGLQINSRFLYKDEFEHLYGSQGDYPQVWIEKNQQLQIFIHKDWLEQCQSLQQLMRQVQQQLLQISASSPSQGPD